jgi:hypothetical protein
MSVRSTLYTKRERQKGRREWRELSRGGRGARGVDGGHLFRLNIGREKQEGGGWGREGGRQLVVLEALRGWEREGQLPGQGGAGLIVVGGDGGGGGRGRGWAVATSASGKSRTAAITGSGGLRGKRGD